MKRARHRRGSVVFDKRRKVWNYLWCDDSGTRHTHTVGPLRAYPTKARAWEAVNVSHSVNTPTPKLAPTVEMIVQQYRHEKMPTRHSTRLAYECWLRNHILPKWGKLPLTEVQPRAVELWLAGLQLTPKSRVHIRGLLYQLWDFAMWANLLPIERNPIELVRVKRATKRTHSPRSLTVDEFQKFIQHHVEPFRTLALVSLCFGLRISEALGLKWRDVDWLRGKLTIERGIVRQVVDDVKTEYSHKTMSIDPEMLAILTAWKQMTEFSAEEDWIFASPAQIGRLPWSYPHVWKVFQEAAKAAGIGKLGTHAMRHTYRAWLDAVGTPVAVQQKLMRHSDIRTTMNIYGDVVTDEMAQAQSKVVGLVLGKVIAN